MSPMLGVAASRRARLLFDLGGGLRGYGTASEIRSIKSVLVANRGEIAIRVCVLYKACESSSCE